MNLSYEKIAVRFSSNINFKNACTFIKVFWCKMPRTNPSICWIEAWISPLHSMDESSSPFSVLPAIWDAVEGDQIWASCLWHSAPRHAACRSKWHLYFLSCWPRPEKKNTRKIKMIDFLGIQRKQWDIIWLGMTHSK